MKRAFIGLFVAAAFVTGCSNVDDGGGFTGSPPTGWGEGAGTRFTINGVTFTPRDADDEIMVTTLADGTGCKRIYYVNRISWARDSTELLAMWCPE